MSRRAKRRTAFLAGALLLAFVVLYALPRAAALGGVSQVVHTAERKDVNAGALFYTETDQANEAAAWWRDSHKD